MANCNWQCWIPNSQDKNTYKGHKARAQVKIEECRIQKLLQMMLLRSRCLPTAATQHCKWMSACTSLLLPVQSKILSAIGNESSRELPVTPVCPNRPLLVGIKCINTQTAPGD